MKNSKCFYTIDFCSLVFTRRVFKKQEQNYIIKLHSKIANGLIQNKKLRKHRKTKIWKIAETRIKQNNDHKKIMRNIRFRSSFETNKTTKSTYTSTKLIKENSNIFGDFIFGNYNNYVSYSIFPISSKNAIITPVYKEGAKTSKDDYSPVNILLNISTIYDRLIFKQTSEYFLTYIFKISVRF